MQLQEFSQNRYVRNFLNDRWIIGGTTGLVLVFALGYTAFVYKPSYQSEAKVWIKDTATASYLSSIPDTPGYFRPLSQSGNPVMTQIEILNSREMESYLADLALGQALLKKRNESETIARPDTRNIIKVRTEPNNDVLNIQLKWQDPVMAQRMLQAALNRLDEVNLDINRKIHTRKREYLETQLAALDQKLLGVRNRIKNYQSGNLAIDVDTQTHELVKLRSQLVAQLESVTASRNNNATNARALQNQLAMAPRQALNAVALGSGNVNLVKLRGDLAALRQQYAHDSVKEAPTNPHLLALGSQIRALEAQIQKEIQETLGKGNSDGNGPRIYDGVRGELVHDLATSRARTAALGSEASSLSAAIARVDEQLKSIPESRFAMMNLQEEEKALALAYDELRKKQIEASIKEAETPSNVFVVDAPSMPEKASFPAPKHILLMSSLLGLMAGLGLSMFKTRSEDLCNGVEAVEEATRSKVLGIIPWLPQPTALFNTEDGRVLSIQELSLKHLIANLQAESARHEAEVITFSSSSMRKPYHGTVYALAQRLARMGHSVALIDTDSRPGNLHAEMEESGSALELTDLIMSVDLKLRKGEMVYPEEILSALKMDAQGIYLGLNRNEVTYSYDYFACRGFKHIVQVLKEHFDWVLIDTPSAVIAPEFLTISRLSDGVVLFADHKATFSTLHDIARKIREHEAPLLGTIVRESNPQLERAHREYTDWRNGPRGGGSQGELVKTAGSFPVMNDRRVEFMGVRIDALTLRETLERIGEIIERGERVQHVVVNVAKLMSMRHDPELRNIINSSPLVNADGAGVVWGARLLGLEIPERVTGIDLMEELVSYSNQRNYRIFFLGAEENVVREVLTIYKRRFPNLQICGYRNGYFKPEDEVSVVRQIREAQPDILFVGMGSPRKEKFIHRYKSEMDVPFVMGVGGSFDVIAGKISRAPHWMREGGLEWFYRLIQEPGRMWKRYLLTNLEYGLALANAKLRTANG